MSSQLLQTHVDRIGARAQPADNAHDSSVRLDIHNDRHGQDFDVLAAEKTYPKVSNSERTRAPLRALPSHPLQCHRYRQGSRAAKRISGS